MLQRVGPVCRSAIGSIAARCWPALPARLALQEESRSLPFGAVWDYYCESKGVPVGKAWLAEVWGYEKEVLLNRR